MQIISHSIPGTEDIKIIPLADLHIGDKHCDIKLIKDTINKIKGTKNCFTILDGDLMNAAIMGSKSDVYGEIMPPQEQLRTVVELFKPLADAGKILAILPGNHEERISRTTGVDMTEIFAAQLNLSEIYSPTSALIYIKLGQNPINRTRKICYSILSYHGTGGGKRPGSKINRLQDMALIVADCDVYLAGHTHLPASFRDRVLVTSPQNQTIKYRERIFVNTCSFLDWSGSYGDRMGLPPQSKTPPEITLKALTHEVKVTL